MDIQTERLVIVPATFERYSNLSNQYKMGPHIKMYLDQAEKDVSHQGWGVWFVIQKDNKQVIGDIGFKGKPDEGGIVEVGYGILPAEQNKGFATEAVAALVHWAFTTGKVEKVIAECLEDNFASIKVLEKVGLKKTSAIDGMVFWEKVRLI